MTAQTKAKAHKKPTKLMTIRYRLQGFVVFATFLIGLRHVLPGEGSTGGSFDAFCPFGGIESLLPFLSRGQALKTNNLLNFALLIGVLGVSLVAGRAFCGWMCPLGGIQDYLARLARRLSGEKRYIRGKKSPARFPMRPPRQVDKWARYIKYLILAIILWVSVTAVYPPLHFLCPVRAIFGLQMTRLLWGILIIFIVTSMLVERFWCKYLCPFGAVLAPFNKIAPLRLKVDESRCVDCGRCDTECPMDIEDAHANSRDLECIQCLECLETCALKDTITLEMVTIKTPTNI